MKASEITADMLPLYQIEVLHPVASVGWYTFTHDPFRTREEAELHRHKIIESYVGKDGDASRVRVAEYGRHQWHAALIEEALGSDKDTLSRLLSALRPELIREALDEMVQ